MSQTIVKCPRKIGKLTLSGFAPLVYMSKAKYILQSYPSSNSKKEKLGVQLPSLPSTKVKFIPNINYNNLLIGMTANLGIHRLKQIISKDKVKLKT